MPRPTYATLTATALASAQRTATATGSAISLAINHDVFGADAHTGYLEKGLIFVDQTAGSGNNGGNNFEITVQTAASASGPWLTVPLSASITLTANAATTYGATFNGPLAGFLRVVATEVGTADATFAAYVIVGG